MVKIRLAFFDFIVFFLILGAAAFFFQKSFSGRGDKVLVHTNDGSYEYSLDKNGLYRVEGDLGTTVFEIKDGRVRIVDSPCPNKTCIHMGWSSPLVCLPNQVVVEIVRSGNGGEKGDFDGLSR